MITEEQIRVAITSPDHLKRWLQETGRKFVIFESKDLVDSLPWPEGVDSFIQFVQCYEHYRRTVETGDTAIQKDVLGNSVEIPVYKSDILTKAELESCIRFLLIQLREVDPNWNLGE